MFSLTFLRKLILTTIAVALFWLSYSNHFNNPFEFDDEHTIVTNTAIRDINNIPRFFTDATTTSSLPANQAYRPGLTTLNAIDYFISGTAVPNPFYFHVSIFISIICLGICLFFFSQHLFKSTTQQPFLWALLVSTLFCIHTANSQTINYIIARADSFSTLMVVLSLVMYVYLPVAKKYYLYMLPVIIGFMVKEPAVMFVPLLMTYKLLFEKETNPSPPDPHPFHINRIFSVLKQTAIPLLVVLSLFILSRQLTPKHWTSGTSNVFGYLITQPFVIIHYFNNFFLPFNLVIDTDWEILPSITDDRFIVGFSFLILMVIGIFTLARKHPLISFGLAWFLLALLPTSSIFPLAEVLNDHRPFFAYIGLCIASVYLLVLVFKKQENNARVKTVLSVAIILVLLIHGYGTYQQNKIWNNSESLWKEATIKAPKNGRAWMNYANTLMARAAYAEAEVTFNKAAQIWPYYSYMYINLGVLKAATGRDVEAEMNLKKALQLDPMNPECYVYYGNFLMERKRLNEAAVIVGQGLQTSPTHSELIRLKEQVDVLVQNPHQLEEDKIKELKELATRHPTHENYLNLSLAYYNASQFENCIKASEEALKIKPNYSLAYNNICASYNKLGKWDKSIEAGQKGLLLEPDNQLLKGNLKVALENKGK